MGDIEISFKKYKPSPHDLQIINSLQEYSKLKENLGLKNESSNHISLSNVDIRINNNIYQICKEVHSPAINENYLNRQINELQLSELIDVKAVKKKCSPDYFV